MGVMRPHPPGVAFAASRGATRRRRAEVPGQDEARGWCPPGEKHRSDRCHGARDEGPPMGGPSSFSGRSATLESTTEYSKAVEQPISPGGHEILLAASAGAVRRVPGSRVLSPTLPVMVADSRGTSAIGTGEVVAVVVALARKRSAVRIGPGNDVVHVGGVPAAVHGGALLGERIILGQLVVVAVEIGDVLSHLHALRV